MSAPKTTDITLDEIAERLVDPSIITKMIPSYFKNVEKPSNNGKDKVFLITCADSRLPPAEALGFERGQAFTMQTVANVVPDLDINRSYEHQHIEVSAAIQYGVKRKNVKEIIVLGHSDCGGAEARLAPPSGLNFLNTWMRHVDGEDIRDIESEIKSYSGFKLALPKVYEATRREAEKICLHTSLNNIRSIPFLKEALKKSEISLTGAIMNIEKGLLNIKVSSNSSMSSVQHMTTHFEQFRNKAFGENGCLLDRAHEQHPKALIVTGISPEVAPEVLFGIEPEDALGHRRPGAHYHHERTPDGLAATIQFAVAAKHVKTLVFIGHKGDVTYDYAEGKIDDLELTKGFIEKSVPEINAWRSHNMAPEQIQKSAMRSTFFHAMKHPDVKAAHEAGELSIVSLLVDNEQKTMEYYDPQSDEFLLVRPPGVEV